MIELTRFSGDKFVLNANLVETVEATPDTVISLIGGKKIIVKESVEEVVLAALEYARCVHAISVPPPPAAADAPQQ